MKGVRIHRFRRFSPTNFLPRGKSDRRRVEYLGGATLAVFTIVIVGAFFASSVQQYALRNPYVAAVVSAVLVELANTDRALNGVETLTVNPVLVAVAQTKANDMAAKEYFAHTSPDGVDPWFWFTQQGYEYKHAGENLAVDFSDSGDVERAWMESHKHRENILNGRYTEIGIAMAEGTYEGRSTTFVVQVFASPAIALAEAGTAASPTPSPAAITREESREPEVLGIAAPTEPEVAAALSQEISSDVPAWGYIVGFPRETLRYVYYIIGLLVLLALAFDTGLELRWHHLRHAKRAGMLLATMSILFVAADYLFFADPVLAFLSP